MGQALYRNMQAVPRIGKPKFFTYFEGIRCNDPMNAIRRQPSRWVLNNFNRYSL